MENASQQGSKLDVKELRQIVPGNKTNKTCEKRDEPKIGVPGAKKNKKTQCCESDFSLKWMLHDESVKR